MKDRLKELCGLRKKVPDNKELNLTQVNHLNVLEFADIMLIITLVFHLLS